MRTTASKIALAAMALSALAYGCKKDVPDDHTGIDEQDAPVYTKLIEEVQRAQSYHNAMIHYQDSLAGCTDSLLIAHCHDMVIHFDSLYHHSETLWHAYHDQLNDLHHCDMMEECEAAMDNMMHGGGMMGNDDPHDGNEHECDLMDEIETHCAALDELEHDHAMHCPN